MLQKTLRLGALALPSPLIQGPLAGFSHAPMRALTWPFGGVGFCCTEMISAKTLLYTAPDTYAHLVQRANNESYLCYQLSSNNPEELARAVKKVSHWGADLIDLNCGCPKPKIRAKGTGSYLLSDTVKLAYLLDAMRKNTSLPISIKIRVDGVSGDAFNVSLVKMINDSGLDFITVHGRHWTDDYNRPCFYDQIQFFVEELKIPVIGNGDVSDLCSLQKMLNTGCAGVMISRAATGRPWIFQELLTLIDGKSFERPSDEQIENLFFEHVRQLSLLLKSEKMAKFNLRKAIKYYGKWLSEERFLRIKNFVFTD